MRHAADRADAPTSVALSLSLSTTTQRPTSCTTARHTSTAHSTMRLPLVPARSFLSQSALSSSDPPLVFIDDEPFLVELQGSLEGPTGETSAGQEASKAADLIEGARVGKVDLSDPVRLPLSRPATHSS